MTNVKELLPIGTVIMLKGGSKRVMITGFLGQGNSENSKEMITYDYIGCLYPEGMLSAKTNLLFNHVQIDKVYSLGYSDEEEKNFKLNLDNASKELLNNNVSNSNNVVPDLSSDDMFIDLN